MDDREAYVNGLFREFEEEPATPPRRVKWGPILLGVGLVLLGIGLLVAFSAPTAEAFLSFALPLNVLAVLCVAAGVLLLPERPAPIPPDPGARRARKRVDPGRWRLYLPHIRLRRTRH